MTDAPVVSIDDSDTAPSARYELREQLSSSSTGSTWRAWDHVTDREVDIRQLRPPQQLALEQRQAMVARRARAALRAQRVGDVPGLVTVLDVLASDDEVLVVSEVAAGESLADVMRDRGRLPSDRAVEIAVALTRTLESLHTAGLAHGDVRPSRVRVDGSDVLLVTHGLARPDEDEPEATLLASPAYLSPQRAAGARTAPTDDVWSLGVLLYAMVEGAPPFTGHSVNELVDAIAHRSAPRSSSASPAVADAIAAMLDKDPAQRPTIAQVRDLLQPRAAAADRAEPMPGLAPTQTPGPPVKPAADDAPAAATSRPVPGPPVTSPTRRRRRSRRSESSGPDLHTVIPLVGIVVLMLISWYLLSKF